MTTINFGISGYSRFSPGVMWEERVMEVPDTGELQKPPQVQYPSIDKIISRKFGLRNYSDVRNYEYTMLPAVCFNLPGGHSHESSETYLVWLPKRNEWIAVRHHEWTKADFTTDELETGPYALDQYCMDKLSEAYSLEKDQVIKDISKAAPSELELMASQ